MIEDPVIQRLLADHLFHDGDRLPDEFIIPCLAIGHPDFIRIDKPENQDAAGFYRLHIWGDERDIMPAHNAFMLVETDNLPRALWEQYPSSARQNTIGIRSDGDNGVTDINEVKVVNREGYTADGIDEGPWFTLSGMKLSERPTKAGLYIHKNRKVVIN
jgi:hypothetical protein